MATIEGLKGSVYQRGDTWWIKYRQHGRVLRESSKSADRRIAEKMLLKRNAKLDEGVTINTQLNKCKVSRLLQLVTDDQQTRQRKDAEGTARRLRKHVQPAFGWRLAAAVTSETVTQYVKARQAQGAAAATINRELAILTRAYVLGVRARLVDQAPPIDKLPENNARSGFFKRADLERVIAGLPDHKGARDSLPALFRFAYFTGWRKGEILALQWRQIDFEAGTVRLAAGTTKNDQPRLCRFTPEIRALLEAQRAHTDDVNRRRGILCPHVFHRSGERIRDFYTAWRRACLAAGLAQKLPDGRIKTERVPHDFRRSAARNLTRAGVSEQIAMKFTGHLTTDTFRRYNITDEEDMAEAAERLGRYQLDEAAKLAAGHNPGTVSVLAGLG